MANKRNKRTQRDPDRQEKSGEVSKLKAQLRREKKKVTTLQSDIKSLYRTIEDMNRFLKDEQRDIPLEVLIRGAAEDKSLKEIRKENDYSCKKCGSTDIYVGSVPNATLLICRSCQNVEREFK